MKKTTGSTPGREPRARRWNSGLHLLHPLFVQDLLSWLDTASASYPEEELRRVGAALAEIEAFLEFPMGELLSPELKGWLLIWHASNRLSEPYSPDESQGRFDAQGLEFLIRVEGESLLGVLLAAKNIHPWRFAISLRISQEELQARIAEVRKGGIAHASSPQFERGEA